MFVYKSKYWWYSLERNARDCSGCGSSSDNLQNLFQSRQASAYLKGHLVCIVLLRREQTEKERYSQGTTSHRLDRGLHGSYQGGSLSFSYRGEGLKSETK